MQRRYDPAQPSGRGQNKRIELNVATAARLFHGIKKLMDAPQTRRPTWAFLPNKQTFHGETSFHVGFGTFALGTKMWCQRLHGNGLWEGMWRYEPGSSLSMFREDVPRRCSECRSSPTYSSVQGVSLYVPLFLSAVIPQAPSSIFCVKRFIYVFRYG